MVQRQAFVAVIGDLMLQQAGVLADRQQAVLLRRHAHAVHRVQVDDEPGVLARRMDRRMNGEARRIDEAGRLLNDVAVQIDLHQGRGCNFIEIPTVRVDQEVVLGPRHPGRDVGEDHVVPPVQRYQPIEGRQFNPHLPFGFGHPRFQRRRRSIRHDDLPYHCSVEGRPAPPRRQATRVRRGRFSLTLFSRRQSEYAARPRRPYSRCGAAGVHSCSARARQADTSGAPGRSQPTSGSGQDALARRSASPVDGGRRPL
ncbi:hypothetical protein D3C72_1055000 [compost metagenome]